MAFINIVDPRAGIVRPLNSTGVTNILDACLLLSFKGVIIDAGLALATWGHPNRYILVLCFYVAIPSLTSVKYQLVLMARRPVTSPGVASVGVPTTSGK